MPSGRGNCRVGLHLPVPKFLAQFVNKLARRESAKHLPGNPAPTRRAASEAPAGPSSPEGAFGLKEDH